MPRKNRNTESARNRRTQTRKSDRMTVRWLDALRSTPGFVREERILP